MGRIFLSWKELQVKRDEEKTEPSEKGRQKIICNLVFGDIMPFTPFHFGPGLLVGLLLLSFIDFPTFLIASVIVDVEPLLVLIFRLNYPLHGFFHSLFGGTVVAVLLTSVISPSRERFSPFLSFFKLEQTVSFKRILVAALSGIYIHILLDSRIYAEIQPLYPLEYNPLLTTGILAGLDSYVICIWSFFGAAFLYIFRLFLFWRKSRG